MRILMVIDAWFPYIGGGQLHTLELAKKLSALGYEIEIITRNLGEWDESDFDFKIKRIGSINNFFSILGRIEFLFKAYFYILKTDYEILHLHAFIAGLLAPIIKLFKKKPIIFTVHGTAINTGLNSGFSSWIEKVILTRLKYDVQITVSRDFIQIQNINKNIRYIPNGVNIEEFKHIKPITQSWPTLIYTGRLHPQKNLIRLIDAIKLVEDQIKNIKLLIIGDGILKEQIKQHINYLNLSKNIIVLGGERRDNILGLIKGSHLFILPSIYEGMSLSLLEAMAAKIPVLVSNVGDNKYMIKDGWNGYIIDDPFSVKHISEKMVEILNKKSKLKIVGNNGYKTVEKYYTWDVVAEKTIKLYKETLNVKS